MKLDKIKFAKVVSWISRITNGLEFAEADLIELDNIIDMPIPSAAQYTHYEAAALVAANHGS